MSRTSHSISTPFNQDTEPFRSLDQMDRIRLPALPWRENEIERLRSDKRFLRVEQAYERVVRNHVDQDGRAIDGRAEQILENASDALYEYSRVLLLANQGLPKDELAPHLSLSKVREWLRGRVPGEIKRHDPDVSSRLTKRLVLDPEYAPERAGVLAACAAVIRVGSKCDPICFVRKNRETLELLQSDLKLGFDIDSKIFKINLKGERWYRITLAGKEIIEFVQSHTDFNHRVPWENLLTQAERRRYLSRLLSFCSGEADLNHDRIEINKDRAPKLIDGIAVVFKREGYYPRVHGANHTNLGFFDPLELQKLANSNLVHGKLQRSLQAFAGSTRDPNAIIDEYFTVRELVQNNRRRKYGVERIRDDCEMDGLKLVSESGAIAGWIRGHQPRIVQRYLALTEIERNVITVEDLKRVGREFKSRLGEFNPQSIIDRIIEWHGDIKSTAEFSAVSEESVQRFKEERKLPSREEYRRFLGTIGLGSDQELINAFPASKKEIFDALQGNSLQKYFAAYQGSVLLAANSASAKGEDPIKAATNKLRETVARHRALRSD